MSDEELPERLFATDRYPSNRLNVYSKPDYLTFIHHTLRGTPDFDTIRKSTFGKLYDIPAVRVPNSGKLIHGLLSRQLLTKNKYTLHTTFGGKPLLFSLKEFGELTGLNCGVFPDDYETDFVQPATVPLSPYWKQLIGDDPKTTLADIGDMLADNETPPWKKLRLALLLIVDGVLIASHQIHRPTPKYVNMLQDLDKFLSFPWGRESFLKTLSCMRPGKKPLGKPLNMVKIYRQQLQQSTYKLKGFPLPLQLLAYRSIPKLLEILPDSSDTTTLLELPDQHIPSYICLSLKNILQVESYPDLVVHPRLHISHHPQPGWGIWYDEHQDQKVEYMDSLISAGHVFTKNMWPGGDDSLPINVYNDKGEDTVHKKHIINRKRMKQAILSSSLGVKRPSTVHKKKMTDKKAAKKGKHILHQTDLESLVEVLKNQVNHLTMEVKHLNKRIALLEQKPLCKKKHKFGKFSTQKMKSFRKRKRLPQEQTTPDNNPSTLQTQFTQQPIISLSEKTPSPQKKLKHPSSGESEDSQDQFSSDSQSNKEYDNLNGGGHTSMDDDQQSEDETSKEEPKLHQTVNPKDNITSCSNLYGIIYSAPDDTLPSDEGNMDEDLRLTQRANQQQPKVQDKVVSPKNQPSLEQVINKIVQGPDFLTDQQSCGHVPMDNDPKPTTDVQTKELPSYNQTENRSTEHIQNEDQGQAGQSSHSTHVSTNSQLIHQISDSSPAKPTPKYHPNELELAMHTILTKHPTIVSVFPSPITKDWKLVKNVLKNKPHIKHLTQLGFEFNNQFILDLAKPQKWVNTTHMEVLMTHLWERNKQMFSEERIAFASPWFANHLQGKYRSFSKAFNKELLHWGKKMQSFIKCPGKTWLEDVETVYAPMIWDDRHWVGLAIHLNVWSVEILDPQPTLYDKDKEVAEFMAPITEMLPYIIRKLCKATPTQINRDKPFHCSRVTGLYCNKRSGDCGPVSIKFMEMHAMGELENGMEMMDDKMVDSMRKEYAMDIYRKMVIPIYNDFMD